MLAIASDELEMLDSTIESLKEYKESLNIWRIKQIGERPQQPTSEILILLTKFQTINLSYTEIFKMVSEHSDIIDTATEFHQMIHNNKKDKP